MVVIARTEFVGDVLSASTFTSTIYDVNPGLSQSFPWLAGVANNYAHYRMSDLVFTYVPTSGDALNNTNAALGTVFLRWVPDPTLPQSLNAMELQNSINANAFKPSTRSQLECNLSGSGGYSRVVRYGAIPSGQDPRMFDYGYLQLSVEGCQSVGFVAGKLFITYNVELTQPEPLGGVFGRSTLSSYYTNTNTNIADELPFGLPGGWVDKGGPSSMAVTFVGSTSNDTGGFQFPQWLQTGRFLVNIVWSANSASTNAQKVPPLATYFCTVIDTVSTATQAATAQCSIQYIVDVWGKNSKMVWTGSSDNTVSCLPDFSGGGTMHVFITQFNSAQSV